LRAIKDIRDAEREIAKLQAEEAAGTPPDASSGESGIIEGSSGEYSHDKYERRGRRRGASKRPRRGQPSAPPRADDGAFKAEAAIRVVAPNTYEGRSIQEHSEFFRKCETVFRLKPRTYGAEATKVTWAASYFGRQRAAQWQRHEKSAGEDVTSWEEFRSLTLDWVQSKTSRQTSVAEKYERATQNSTQDVRGFAVYLQSLEDELAPYSEAHRLTHMLVKIRPDIRRAIVSLEHQPTTVDELIESASRVEENLRAAGAEPRRLGNPLPSTNKPQEGRRNETGERYASSQNPQLRQQGAGYVPSTAPNTTPLANRGPRPQVDLSKIKCYNCQKFGHYSSSCPDKVAVRITSASDEDSEGTGKARGQ